MSARGDSIRTAIGTSVPMSEDKQKIDEAIGILQYFIGKLIKSDSTRGYVNVLLYTIRSLLLSK